VIINTRWNVVAKGGLVLPILSLYTQRDAFTQSKDNNVRLIKQGKFIYEGYEVLTAVVIKPTDVSEEMLVDS
jgi:hypothetical protein